MNQKQRLPNDVARCSTGEKCWQKEQCARYVCKGAGKWVTHFTPVPPARGEECLYLIPIKEINNDDDDD